MFEEKWTDKPAEPDDEMKHVEEQMDGISLGEDEIDDSRSPQGEGLIHRWCQNEATTTQVFCEAKRLMMNLFLCRNCGRTAVRMLQMCHQTQGLQVGAATSDIHFL